MGKQACKWKTTARDKRHLADRLYHEWTLWFADVQASTHTDTHTHAQAFGMCDFHTQMEMQQTSDYKKLDD